MKAPFDVQPIGPVTSRTPKVPVRWAWHYRVLCRLRNELMDHRSKLLEEAQDSLRRPGRDAADFATEEYNRDVILAELSHTQDALYEIEAALKRIEAGSYGICEETGKRIPAARLKAVPFTRFCCEAELTLEKRGFGPRLRIGQLHSAREVFAK